MKKQNIALYADETLSSLIDLTIIFIVRFLFLLVLTIFVYIYYSESIIMQKRAQTIQIFLPDGNPRGIRIADILSRTVKAVLFPRNQFEYMLQREELANVGFYFLFGKSDEGKDFVYIGEAENCAERLKSHHSKKDFWNYGIAIVSKTHSLTKTHVKFLEHYSIEQARAASRYQLENSVDPAMPYVTESMEAEMMDCFDTAKILLSTLGYPLFDSVSKKVVSRTSSDVFRLRGKRIQAEGNLIDDGFVVFKGSEAKLKTVPSCHKYLIDLRTLLEETHVIEVKDNIYEFREDYIFTSPSTVAGVLLGRSANGWKEWENLEEKTLYEIKRNVLG